MSQWVGCLPLTQLFWVRSSATHLSTVRVTPGITLEALSDVVRKPNKIIFNQDQAKFHISNISGKEYIGVWGMVLSVIIQGSESSAGNACSARPLIHCWDLTHVCSIMYQKQITWFHRTTVPYLPYPIPSQITTSLV